MFGRKQKRIEELERKIDGYVVSVRRYRQVIDQQENKILSLTKELEEYEKDTDEIKTLKEMRIEMGMTQRQVAEKMGTKSSFYISQIERGYKNPSFNFICKLADLYECTPVEIVESLTKDGWGVSDDRK